MALIKWDDRLALNVPELDRQHQKLVALINELDAAMHERQSREAVSRILDGLVSYTEFHFGVEARLLEEHGMTGSPSELEERDAFVRRISDFKAGHARGQMGLSVGVMTFLSEWLRSHITGADRAFADRLVASGIGKG